MATVKDLIDFLKYKIDNENMDENAELVGVFQPNYPLQSTEFYILDNSSESETVYLGFGQGYDYSTKKVYDEGEIID